MPTVKEVYQYIDSFAPFSLQMDFDNAGHLVGEPETEVGRILVALDVTESVVREAARKKCKLIVTHHPVIFHPLKALTGGSATASNVAELVRKGIAVISAHTNLDLAPGGVNDVLLDRLGLVCDGILEPMGTLPGTDTPYGLGRVGHLKTPMAPAAFAKAVKKALDAKGVRLTKGDREVRKVALCGGSGGDLIDRTIELGCDALVTADVKYDQFLEAAQRGVTLIDAGHFATENPVVEALAGKLRDKFTADGVEVLVSKAHSEVYFAL